MPVSGENSRSYSGPLITDLYGDSYFVVKSVMVVEYNHCPSYSGGCQVAAIIEKEVLPLEEEQMKNAIPLDVAMVVEMGVSENWLAAH